jgi:hypothetical protein
MRRRAQTWPLVAAHLVACALGASGVRLVLNQSVNGSLLRNNQTVYNLTSPACVGQCVPRVGMASCEDGRRGACPRARVLMKACARSGAVSGPSLRSSDAASFGLFHHRFLSLELYDTGRVGSSVNYPLPQGTLPPGRWQQGGLLVSSTPPGPHGSVPSPLQFNVTPVDVETDIAGALGGAQNKTQYAAPLNPS